MQRSFDGVAAVQPTLNMTLGGHHHGVRSVAFQPSPSTPHVTPSVVSGGMDGAVMLWDTSATARAVRFTGHRGPVLSVAQSSRPQLFASGGQDGYVRIWSPDVRRSSTVVNAFSAGKATNSVCEWRAHSGATRAVAFAQDGSDRLYSIGDDKAVKAWDLVTMSAAHTRAKRLTNRFVGSFAATPLMGYAAAGHTSRVSALAVQSPLTSSHFCHYVASGGEDGVVFVWDTRSRDAVHVIYSGGGSGVKALSFHPDGHVLASGDDAGDVNLFDLRRSGVAAAAAGRNSASSLSTSASYSLLQHYHAAHMSAGGVGTTGVAFAPNGGWLLSSGDDGTAKLWDVKEGHLYCTVEAHEGPVTSCAFSQDGSWFVTGGGADRRVLVWRSGLAASSVSRAVAPTPSASLSFSEQRAATTPPVPASASSVQRPVSAECTPPRSRTPPTAESSFSSLRRSPRVQAAPPRRVETVSAPPASAAPPPAPQRPPIPLAPQSPPRASLPAVIEETRAEDSAISHHTDTSDNSARERSFERCEERYSHLATPPTSRGGAAEESAMVKTSERRGEGLSSVAAAAMDVVTQEEREQELLLARERAHHREQRDQVAEERVANLEDAVAALVAYIQRQQTQQEERMNALQAASKEQAERSEASMAELKRAIAVLTSRIAPEGDATTEADAEEKEGECTAAAP